MKKIAIIEDDQAISQMYRMKFENEGYEVETAENGEVGLELIKKMKPDIILLDVMMPIMNGDEMLAKLRNEPWGKDTKVIILTNIGEQELPKSLLSLDVLDIMMKAELTPRQVAETVKKALDNISGKLLSNQIRENSQ
jgi:DNA-binding response OmpR family regulator